MGAFSQMIYLIICIFSAHASLLLANFIVALFYMFTGASGAISTFGLALLYTFLFTPASFVCWFRPAYKAFRYSILLSFHWLSFFFHPNIHYIFIILLVFTFRDDSSLYFMVFFFVFFFQFLMSMIYCFGIGGMGSW